MSYYYIIHHIPGRLRLKFPQLRNQPRLAKRFEAVIGAIRGVKFAEVSTVTGSLLIRYECNRLGDGALFEALEQAYRQSGLPDNTEMSCAITHRPHDPALDKVAGRFVDMMVEKCIERSAIALLGVLL